MTRIIYERDTDELFATALERSDFADFFLDLILPGTAACIRHTTRQTPHTDHSGTIDLELRLEDGCRLLIENKIDAGYSITREGTPQPERYAASVAALRSRGVTAYSVLLAPQAYLSSSRFAGLFDRTISYESLRPVLSGVDRALLDAAIAQAEAPYEPVPNPASADFFQAFADHAARGWPSLVIKRNPNGNGVRPEASRTIYFDVSRTLRTWPGVPRPRMSLQCRDSAAPTASVKIMIGNLGRQAGRIPTPKGLASIRGYLRAAGQSLGCVIDTPRLDTQRPFKAQLRGVETGLDAADRLRLWWNGSESEVIAITNARI